MLANANYHVIRFLASREPSLLEPAYTNLVNVRDELRQVIAVLENFEKSALPMNHANVGQNPDALTGQVKFATSGSTT
jgi:hypothetical protein